MELEHYPGMTEKAIEAMIDEAQRRFDICGARVIHRVGLLQPLDQIVMVAVTSAHRGKAFQACEFLMDYLKTQAPFWKKEHTPDGARWVDARAATTRRWRAGASPAATPAEQGRRLTPTLGAGPAVSAGAAVGACALARRPVAERRMARLSARHAAGQLRRRLADRHRAGRFDAQPDELMRLLVVTGFLGGLTTFSAYSVESLILLQRGHGARRPATRWRTSAVPWRALGFVLVPRSAESARRDSHATC